MRTSLSTRFAWIVASMLICLSTACTTLSPVATDATGAQIRAAIKAGDTVRVRTTAGASHTFQVSVVGETSLVGNAVGTWKSDADVVGSQIELPYRDIEQIERQHVSAVKTTALVAAVAVVAAVAIATNNGTKTPGCCTSLASH
jgi:hypothetical protein